MANKNEKWFIEFGNKYGVSYQILMSKNGTVAQAIIGSYRHTGLGQLNKNQLEELFKNSGKTDMANNVTVSSSRSTITLNGRKYGMLEIIRGIKVNKLLDIIDNSKKTVAYYDFCNWLLDDSNRREYLRTVENSDFWVDYLRLEYYFQTGEIKSNVEDLIRAWETLADDLAGVEGVKEMELVGV
jgi:hypothetical protein